MPDIELRPAVILSQVVLVHGQSVGVAVRESQGVVPVQAEAAIEAGTYISNVLDLLVEAGGLVLIDRTESRIGNRADIRTERQRSVDVPRKLGMHAARVDQIDRKRRAA